MITNKFRTYLKLYKIEFYLYYLFFELLQKYKLNDKNLKILTIDKLKISILY